MSKRYFINNLDGLIGNSIIQQLTKSQTEEGEPEEEIEATHMGTYLDQNRLDKGRGVRKILKRIKPKLSRKKMLEECDVYVYDMNSMINDENKQDFSDIKFVNEVLKGAELEEEKVMILVSDVRVWSNTEKKIKVVQEENKEGEEGEEGEEGQEKQENNEDDEENQAEDEQEDQNSQEKEEGEDDGEEGEKNVQSQKDKNEQQQEEEEEQVPVEYTSYVEADYQKRVPLDKYKKLKRMEDMILSLSGKENLKVYVICSGVLYGEGEVLFKNLFQAAWLQQPAKLPYLGEGDNIIPTIHVQDLAKFVIKVAESPPEEQKYLFAVDNSQKKTQKDIIQAIASGVGSGLIESVEKTELIGEHQEDIFKLNIDLTPSSLLVSNDEENPVEFEWFSEKGLIENHQKVLAQFWTAHDLRPLKILMTTPEDEREKPESQFEWAAQKISEHYRIPILKVEEIIKEAAENIHDDILGDDVREEQENLLEYLNSKEKREIDETMKVFYRVLKWRLSQNDCKNRGFILDNFPRFSEEANIIFFPQKGKKLERVRPKPKKMKRRRKQKAIDEQEEEMRIQKEKEEQEEEERLRKLKEQEENQEGEENEDGEDGEENEDAEDEEKQEEDKEQQEEGEDQGEEGEEKESQPDSNDPDFNSDDWEWYEVEEEEKKEGEGEEGEEQQAEEQEEQEEEEQEEEGAAPKREVFYPESFIFVKRMERKQDAKSAQSEIMDYFSHQNQEIFNYDMVGRQQFEVIEALRTYIERNTRPFNYLQPWQELKASFDEFYYNKNASNLEEKSILNAKAQQEIQIIKEKREKICKEQIEYVKEHEGEIDIIKSLPFRNYLLEYVVPELNDGLVQVSNFLPDDPVEFLAEYLYEKSFEFSNN